ncbi:hypothetical protein ACM26V_24690 [Salipaludibacillus sp. HK11]|uniref:hypothetical protein n=1 Tax=Salipaludibacillus sp. HK11 TaxID=3394320 RepID=UPI0039FCC5C1
MEKRVGFTMILEERLKILARVDDIVDNQCKGCEFNKRGDNYCKNKCKYGKELLKLGNKLTKNSNVRRVAKEADRQAFVKKKKKKEAMKVNKVEEKSTTPKRSKLIRSAKVDTTKGEYMRLIKEGYQNKEIASLMGISPVKLSQLKNNKWGLNGWNRHKKVVSSDPRQIKEVKKLSDPDLPKVEEGSPYAPASKEEKLHAEIIRLKKENEEIGKIRVENEELSEHIELLKGQIQAKDRSFVELEAKFNHLKRDASNQMPAATEEERAYAYETLKSKYKRKLDNQNIAFEDLENQLDESHKRFDRLEDRCDALQYALKMFL